MLTQKSENALAAVCGKKIVKCEITEVNHFTGLVFHLEDGSEIKVGENCGPGADSEWYTWFSAHLVDNKGGSTKLLET